MSLVGVPTVGVDHRDGRVRFRWKDYADHDRVKVLTLEADEFLRRFLLHVVPRGFMRIRHFGLLANRTRRGTVTMTLVFTLTANSADTRPVGRTLTGFLLGAAPTNAPA
jgi:Putative transposase